MATSGDVREERDPLELLGDAVSKRRRAARAVQVEQVDTVRDEVADAQRRLQVVRDDVDRRLADSTAKVRDLEASVVSERQAREAALRDAQELADRANRARTALAAAEARANAERNDREALTAELTALLESEQRRAGERIDALEATIVDLNVKLDESELARSAERDERARVEITLLSDAEAQITALRDELDDARAAARRDIADRDARLRDLSERLANETERLEAAHEAQRETKRALDTAISEREDQRRRADAQAKRADEERARVAAERARVTEVQTAAAAAAEAAVAERTRLEAELRNAAAASATAATRTQQLEQQLVGEQAARATAEQSVVAAQTAEREAVAAAERLKGAADVMEREAAAARAQAQGTQDALGMTQRELSLAVTRTSAAEDALARERIERQALTAQLERHKEEAARLLETVRVEASIRLDTERAGFAAERRVFEDRLDRAQLEASALLEGERAAAAAQRQAVEQRLEALKGDIDATIGGLQVELASERERTNELVSQLAERTELAAQKIAEAEAAHAEQLSALQQANAAALQASEERLAELVAELARRDEIVERLGSVVERMHTEILGR